MKRDELMPGRWYLYDNGRYIRFSEFKDDLVWVSACIYESGSYQFLTAFCSSLPVREASREEYAMHPIMGTYPGEINNYEIF